MNNFNLETTTINQLFFEAIKRETKALTHPTKRDDGFRLQIVPA